MKNSVIVRRGLAGLIAIVGLAGFPQFTAADEQTTASFANERTARPIRIVDQDGRVDAGVQPSAASQIVDVSVGPAGQRVFSPSTVNISVGDTVRWTWASSNHSVTSGASCTADSQFCSPNDLNCPAGVLSNTGAVYQHTFGQAGTYFYFCDLHCGSGMTGTVNVAAPCAAPPPDMVGWYAGDGNGRDLAGGNNGVLVGGATFAPGKVGQAFLFNGTTAYVQAPPNAAQDPTTAGSQDAWVMFNELPSTANHTMQIIGKGGNGTDFDLQANIDNRFRFYIGTSNNVGSTTVIQTGVWYHVAATWDATGLRMYVNGVIESTDATPNLTRGQSNNPLQIGSQPTFGPRPFNGLIDEAEVFNRALTQSEITAIFNAGAAGKCKPPQPTAAFSRKVHGGAGTFDIDLMPLSVAGVECRTGGPSGIHQMVVQFPSAVTVTSAALSGGTGSVSGFTVTGNTVTADLMNIANAQTIFMKLMGVSDGTLSGDVPVAMGVLLGDVTGNGSVSGSDVSQVKLQSGQPVSASNSRADITANGTITGSDVSSVKISSGTALP